MKIRLLSMLMVAGLLATLTPASAVAAATMSPTTGTTSGRTLVTIYGGSGYNVGTTVTLCGKTAGVTTIAPDGSSLTFMTPPCDVAGLYEVTTQSPSTLGLPGFYYVAPTPQAVTLTPASGSIAGGTVVALRAPGQGPFVQGTTTASICGASATNVVVVDTTTLLFATPACATTGIATVTTANPTTVGIPGFTYGPVGPVLSMVPTTGPIGGGTMVQLTGSTGVFSLGCTVVGFSTGSPPVPTPLSPTSISTDGSRLTFVTPPGAAGPVPVTVNLAAWASAGACPAVGGTAGTFTYSGTGGGGGGAPYVSPAAGPAGTVITILNGIGFSVGTLVALCGTTSIPTSVASDGRSLTFLAPACSLTTTQTVSTSNPTYASAGAFTYGAAPPPPPPPAPSYPSAYAPIVTSVSPPNGPTSGGQAVTILGSWFQVGATVTFGNAAASAVNFLSTSALTAVTSAGAPGPVSVTVRNPDGQVATKAGAYTYVTPSATGIAATAVGVNVNGPYSTTTKVVKRGSYVTVFMDYGPEYPGLRVVIQTGKRWADGSWSSWTNLTTRIADADGRVWFYWRSSTAVWMRIRGVGTNYVQVRWS